jgi:hypothetical protein
LLLRGKLLHFSYNKNLRYGLLIRWSLVRVRPGEPLLGGSVSKTPCYFGAKTPGNLRTLRGSMNAAKVGVLIGGFYVAFLCACWLAGKLRARMKRIEADREKTHRDFFGEGGA